MKNKNTPMKMLLPIIGIGLLAAIFLNTAAYQYKRSSSNRVEGTRVEVQKPAGSNLPDVALLKKIFHISRKLIIERI